MYADLDRTIFNQFYDLLIAKAACLPNLTCDLNKCNFNYVSFSSGTNANTRSYLRVEYTSQDNCKRKTVTTVIIETTNVCLGDLLCNKWVKYLTRLANEYLVDLCPVEYTVTSLPPSKCRDEPPRWNPSPVEKTTTIYEYIEPVHYQPKPTVIVEPCSPCVDPCVRIPNPPKEVKIIRQLEAPTIPCCNGPTYTVVNNQQQPAHSWDTYKNNIDYNNHKWNSKATGCSSCK